MKFEEVENGIKATVPLITEEDIRIINNDFDGIINKFSKMIIKDKDLATAQYIIKKQQKQINELKINSIPKKKTEDKLEELKRKKIPDGRLDLDIRNEAQRDILQELLEEDK